MVYASIAAFSLMAALLTYYVSTAPFHLLKFGKASRLGMILLGIITFIPSWFLGIVVGGNWGGAAAGAFAERIGIDETYLVPIGIGLGLFSVVTISLSLVMGVAVIILLSFQGLQR